MICLFAMIETEIILPLSVLSLKVGNFGYHWKSEAVSVIQAAAV